MDTAAAIRTAGALISNGYNCTLRQGASATDWAIDVHPTGDIAATTVTSFAASEGVTAYFTSSGTIELR